MAQIGGQSEDYQAIHDWFDADHRHRALKHDAEGILTAGETLRSRHRKQLCVTSTGHTHWTINTFTTPQGARNPTPCASESPTGKSSSSRACTIFAGQSVLVAHTQISVAPDGSPVFTRDVSTEKIYALTVKWP
jgi:hypothetical protein